MNLEGKCTMNFANISWRFCIERMVVDSIETKEHVFQNLL